MKRTILLIAAALLACATLCAQEKVRDAKEKTQYNSVFDLLRNEPGVIISWSTWSSRPSSSCWGISLTG